MASLKRVFTLQKCVEENKDLAGALLEYRSTPVANLGFSPAQIAMSRQLRIKLPCKNNLFFPKIVDVKSKLNENQDLNKKYYNRTSQKRSNFKEGDNIVYQKDGIWEPGKIVSKHKSQRSFIIQNERNNYLRRNTIHIRKSLNTPRFQNISCSEDPIITSNKNRENENEFEYQPTASENIETSNNMRSDVTIPISNSNDKAITTRSGRVIKKPFIFILLLLSPKS